MTDKIAFDDKAHTINAELIDATEDWLVRHKKCPPRSANDWLCRDYLATCSGIIWGAQWFMAGEELCGTEMFLEQLRGAKTKLRSPRKLRACAHQLLAFPQIYFPNYLTVLRMTYLAELPKLETQSEILLSGIMKLAAANLPGVRSDIRRQLRRVGSGYDFTIVDDKTLDRKEARFTRSVFPMMLDNTDAPD